MTKTEATVSESGVVKCPCGRRFHKTSRHVCDFYDNSETTSDRFGRNYGEHVTQRGDSIDPPEGGGSGRRSHGGPSRSNRYAGNCVKCGGRVEAEAGFLVKDNSKQAGGTVWGVEHKPGECIANAQPVQANGMSEKQEGFLRSLLAERNPDADADEIVRIINEDLPNPKAGASAMIDALKQLPKAPKPKSDLPKADQPELAKGDVHVVDGEYYRVHLAQRSENLYACKWDGERFEYTKGAISKLNPGNKITAEQAAEFGHMFERCCFCSLAIDTPESVEVGYGPICARKHNLPWG